MLNQAFNVVPDRFADDRHGAILAGFRRHGYTIREGFGLPRSDRDVLLTWTVHHGNKEKQRDEFEAAGGRVLVCEESYVKMPLGEKHIALSWHDHNGAGVIPSGGGERWARWGIKLQPWRIDTARGHVLVREQRGIGSSLQRCPPNWHVETAAQLRKATRRDVRLRLHPKHDPDKTPDSERFRGCHALITWNSSMACAALIAGIPVFAVGPHIICEGACDRGLYNLETPSLTGRLEVFERVAWGQWSLTEIERGDACDHLLPVAE